MNKRNNTAKKNPAPVANAHRALAGSIARFTGSLNRLATETLGAQKTGDGLQALAWFKEGKLKEIAEYCREDVILTRNLMLYAVEHSFLLFRNKAGKPVRLPLNLAARIAEFTGAD